MRRNFIIFISILILIPTSVISIIIKSYAYEDNNITIENSTTKSKITTVIKQKSKNIKISINKDGIVQELDLEEYIIGVVAGEMPASFETEALKAQAVASRTYAMYQKEIAGAGLKTTTDDQVYINENEMRQKWESDYDIYYNKIKKAVLDTEGLVMQQNNKLFKSFYFAMSNGYTEDSLQVFGESNLESVLSPWDNESLNKFIVDTTFKKEELETLLNINNIDNIEIISRDKTNRVSKIKVNNREFTGIEFRKIINLRSTDFTIKQDGNSYIITTKGYGHGVGMSQYGANGMAKENYTYDEILKHYYKDIEITNL